MADSLIYAGIRRRRRQMYLVAAVAAAGFLFSIWLLATLLL